MGYYTQFELTVQPSELESAVEEAITASIGYDPFEDSVKWYDCDEVTQSVSLDIPALIILDGNGEESGDVWRKAWLNGELVMDWKAQTDPPPPDKELLVKVKELEKQYKLNRIQELEAELKRLKEE